MNSKGQRRTSCKECEREGERSRKRRNPEKISEKYKQWRDENRGKALVNVARHRALSRQIPFDLDAEEIQRRIDIGRCEMTGIKFDLGTPRAWNAPSLDQVTPGAGYTKANVRVVLYALNVMANTWGPDVVVQVATAMTKLQNTRKASASLQSALNARLRERLKLSGSTLFNETWRERTTPSGHQFSAHTASVPRTSGNDCGSWPTPRSTEAGHSTGNADRAFDRKSRLEDTIFLASWPAPCTQDGPNGGPSQGTDRLPGAASLSGWVSPQAADANGSGINQNTSSLCRQSRQLAGWATTTTRDYRHANALPWSERGGGTKGEQLNNQVVHLAGWPTPQLDSFRSRGGDRKNEMGLDQMARTIPEAPGGPARLTASGQMLTGSSAGMESGGQLNPAFSLWLQGYPEEWLFAAPADKPRPRSKKSTGTTASAHSEQRETRSSRKWPQSGSERTSTGKSSTEMSINEDIFG